MNQFPAVRWRREESQFFGFHQAWPVARFHLQKCKIRGPDADDVPGAQRGRGTGASVAGCLDQTDAFMFRSRAFRFPVHVGLIVTPKRDFRKSQRRRDKRSPSNRDGSRVLALTAGVLPGGTDIRRKVFSAGRHFGKVECSPKRAVRGVVKGRCSCGQHSRLLAESAKALQACLMLVVEFVCRRGEGCDLNAARSTLAFASCQPNVPRTGALAVFFRGINPNNYAY